MRSDSAAAAPPVAASPLTPAVAVIRVPAAPVNAPVPKTESAGPLPLTMSRSVKARAPVTDVSCIPAMPTPLPGAPMTVSPPATTFSAPPGVASKTTPGPVTTMPDPSVSPETRRCRRTP